MRNNIYILTEDFRFLYKLNKELKRQNIKFRILNIGKKIPDIPNSIILSTRNEVKRFENYERLKDKILIYSEDTDFNKFLVKVMAAHKVGVKTYSDLLFSIDPGTKKYGLAVFLDDCFLNSHTFYDQQAIIKKIKRYAESFQKGISIKFKFGRGILKTVFGLINQVYELLSNHEPLQLLLVDESRSSKIRLFDTQKKRMPKHEASAIIIALREGIEIDQHDYEATLKNRVAQKAEKKGKINILGKNREDKEEKLRFITENLLSGHLNLKESMEKIKFISR